MRTRRRFRPPLMIQALALVALGAFTGGRAKAAEATADAAKAGSSPGAFITSIDLWVRGAGDHAAHERPAPVRKTRVNLSKQKQVKVPHIDAQYGKLYRYQGVPVHALISGFAPPAGADLALIHFANGMIIPLPFRDQAVMRQLDPLIATAVRTPDDETFSRGTFPEVRKTPDSYLDVRPIQFAGNKLVVAEKKHPAVRAALLEHFTPWRHADSVTGIEFVEARAYYRQFDVPGGKDVKAGLEHFRESCQFCHGARKVGASFGWDFVEPMPAYQWRKQGKHFLYHVKYPHFDAKERGLMMPALRSISEQEAADLWQWLKAVATHPLAAYQPADVAAGGTRGAVK